MNINKIQIEKECEKDFEEIDHLLIEAFKDDINSDHQENILVKKLRQSKSYINELTLVAKIDKKIVGFIMFTKAYVGNNLVLALAPLAILPSFQNQKIGTNLLNYGHKKAKEMNFTHSIVLGNPQYYSRFGYQKASTLNIKCPFNVDEKYFMVKTLNKNNIEFNDYVVYDEAFD